MTILEIEQRIFQLQAELNLFTFKKRGIHETYLWEEPVAFITPEVEMWILNYSRALNHELKELLRYNIEREGVIEMREDRLDLKQKMIVEAVDCLHFLVSIAILSGVTPTGKLIVSGNYLHASSPSFLYRATRGLDNARVNLEAALNWKWWSDYETVDRSLLQHECFFMFKYLKDVCMDLAITPEKLLEVYEQKHAVNIKRQVEGYSRSTKTEADNDAIKV
jgi:hypothetical protein